MLLVALMLTRHAGAPSLPYVSQRVTSALAFFVGRGHSSYVSSPNGIEFPYFRVRKEMLVGEDFSANFLKSMFRQIVSTAR